MTNSSTFSPDWVSPPGDSIAEIVQEHGLSLKEFSERLQVPVATATDLLHGLTDLTVDIAQGLESIFGTPASFWLRRESQYRGALSPEISTTLEKGYRQWLAEIPVSDMAEFGWVTRKNSPAEQVLACLDFFGKATIAEWNASTEDFLHGATLRTSPTFKSRPGALYTWLRKGEVEAAQMPCAPWSGEALQRALADIRALTRERNPERFLPELKRICATCGVAVVIARTPDGCRASGAAKFISTQKALILLSLRYLSDDHFWFTFFHEIGHLFLHSTRGLFLEGNERGDSKEELEANEFSARLLIPREHVGELKLAARNAFSAARFAKKIGVSPGIVVGQLQHLGIIPRQHMNNLKTRFKWGTNPDIG